MAPTRDFRYSSSCNSLIAILALALAAFGQQQSSSSSSSTTAPQEVVFSGYTVHQTIEAGGRISNVTGDEGMYGTLVNQHSGPRVLEQSLFMQANTHEGNLFDSLYVTSFGWGGDPENALRARISKNLWYDFRASFRRDQNFFDYNLLANPLNPSSSTPNVPVLDSPHVFAPTRRMSDIDLTLLPQSRVTFRLGYSRNNMTGPSFTSVHEGTDALLFQPWNTTLNTYRAGIDIRLTPNTVVSYDQTLDYYKGDTDPRLNPFFTAGIPGTGSVELGLPVNTAASQPCGVSTGNTSLIDSSGNLTNLACDGYFAYQRLQRVRTSVPTERVSFRASETPWLDLAASWSYANAEMTTPLNEFFNGMIGRTRTRQFTVTGPAQASQISNSGDLSTTIYLPHHFHVANTLYYWAFRIPETATSTETDWIVPGSGRCTQVPTCSLTVPISSLTPVATTATDNTSFNQQLFRNQTDLVWDGNKKIGARIGYRYGRRHFVHINDFTTGDIDDILVHEQTGLFGIWARPAKDLRLHFDYEHTNYDDVIFRIGPRKQQLYRARATYTPRPWATINLAANLLEYSNGNSLVDLKAHSRSYGASATLNPRERFGFDFSYNFNDLKQNALICFNDTPPTGVTLPVVTNAGVCSDTNNPLLTNGIYENDINFVMAAMQVKPIRRVTLRAGYSLNHVDGTTPQLNILQPRGTLAYNYHQPLASVDVDLVKNLTLHGGYNYYQYNEDQGPGPTASRYFHANNETISLRYAF